MQKLLRQIEALLARQQTQQVALDALWREFGAAVRAAREGKDLTLVDLSAQLGIQKSALSYLEAGQRTWSLELALKAVEALRS